LGKGRWSADDGKVWAADEVGLRKGAGGERMLTGVPLHANLEGMRTAKAFPCKILALDLAGPTATARLDEDGK
jgi:hypothetical protein